MAAMQRAQLPNTPNVVDEFFTDADLVALNEVLVERGISPDPIHHHRHGSRADDGDADAAAIPRALPRNPKRSWLTINLRVCSSWRAYASLAGSPRCACLPGRTSPIEVMAATRY